MNSPFHTEIYTRLWRQYVAPHMDVTDQNEDFAVCRHRRMKGLLTSRQIVFIGEKNDWAQEVSPAFLNKLTEIMDQGRWDYFKLISRSEPDRLLMRLAREKRLPCYSWHSADEYRVDFTGKDWDGYLQSLKSRVRCELRRKLNKAAPLNPQLRLLNDDPELDHHISLFMEKHVSYWAGRGIASLYTEPCQKAMFRAWVHELTRTGDIRFYGMFMEGTLCCIRIGLRLDASEYLSLLTINTNEAYAGYSPGILATCMELEQACHEGVKLFNMGPGKSQVKGYFANSTVPYHTTVLAHPASPAGRLFILKKKYDTGDLAGAEVSVNLLRRLPERFLQCAKAPTSQSV